MITTALLLLGIGLTAPGLVTGGGASPAQASEETLLAEAKDAFIERMSRAEIVGGSLVVLRPDRDLLEVEYGWASVEDKAPADGATIYDWGSITKLITSLAAMQLEAHGRLRIDDPVVKHIPAFRNINNPFGDTELITLRMLMSHTAGLQEASFIVPLSWDGDWPVWEQIEPNFNYMRVERRPGTSYGYSNLGPILLGRVIEVVSRDDYETYVHKNIFLPLEMTESYFDTTPYHLRRQKARSYYAASKSLPRKLYGRDADQGFTTTNGGWKCSIRDFKKFVRFLLGSNDSALQARYDGVLPRPSLESMWTPVTEAGIPNLAAGLGFLVMTEAEQSFVGGSGGANGFVSHMFVHRESRTGVFMVGNTDNFVDVMRATRDSLIKALARLAGPTRSSS